MTIGNHPAFPGEAQGDRSVPQEHDYIQNGIFSSKFPGLMIRDHIAVAAMTGLLSGQYRDTGMHNLSDLPKEAYLIADAMLAEREMATQQEQTS